MAISTLGVIGTPCVHAGGVRWTGSRTGFAKAPGAIGASLVCMSYTYLSWACIYMPTIPRKTQENTATEGAGKFEKRLSLFPYGNNSMHLLTIGV